MTSHPRLVLKLAVLLFLSQQTVAFEILAIVSLPLGSHYMAFKSLFRELAVRGHNVTVMNNFPDEDPPPNLKFIDIQSRKEGPSKTLEAYESIDSMYLHLLNTLRHITLGGANARLDCENLFNSDNVKAHLTAGRKYDVIFVEQFMSDCGLAYAIALYDAPIIGIASHVLLPFTYPRLGLPFDTAADAFYFSNAGPNPSFLQKVETTLVQFLFNSVGRWIIHRNIYDVFDQYLPDNTLNIERDARARIKMMFSNQHFSLTGARPLAPQLLEIGGIHIADPKTVPKVRIK